MTPNPYQRLTAAIDQASGSPQDRDWIESALITLVANKVKDQTSEGALQKVIRQVEESGQSTQDLYGDPRKWALEKTETWRQAGQDVFEAEENWSLKETLVSSLFGGAFLSFLFWLIGLFPSDRPSDQPLGFYFLPPVLGASTLAVGRVFQGAQKKWGFRAACLLTSLSAIVCAPTIAFVLFASYEIYTQTYPNWFHLLVALGLAALGTAAGFLLPSPRQDKDLDEEENYQEDAAWLARFKQELYARGDISDARVREESARVEEHASQSSRSYLEEFGHPLTYALALSGQKKVQPYRLYLQSLMMLVIIGYWGFGLYSNTDQASLLWRIPLFVIILIYGLLSTRRHYRAYQQAKQG